VSEPVLETPRLVLRLPVAADIEGWASFMSDETAMRHLSGPQPRLAAWRAMAAVRGSWALYGFGMFAVIERATGHWVGRVGPWCPEGWPGTEIGWGFLPAVWGRGYATEAASAAMDFAVGVLGWREVVHVIAPENTASAAVAARLGAVKRGPTRLPDPFHEVAVELWGQSAEAWRRRRTTAGNFQAAPAV